MLRILMPILLGSVTISGACWAADKSEAPQAPETANVQMDSQNLGQNKSAPALIPTTPVAATTPAVTTTPTTVVTQSVTPTIATPAVAATTTAAVEAQKPAASQTNGKQEAAVVQATAEAQSDAATDLKLVEFVLANEIVSREPREVVESFTEGGDRGFAFARINSKATTEVTFLWTRNGHECARIKAPIQAARTWRTYSSVKLRSGDWKVQLLDQNKVVLAEKSFSVK